MSIKKEIKQTSGEMGMSLRQKVTSVVGCLVVLSLLWGGGALVNSLFRNVAAALAERPLKILPPIVLVNPDGIQISKKDGEDPLFNAAGKPARKDLVVTTKPDGTREVRIMRPVSVPTGPK